MAKYHDWQSERVDTADATKLQPSAWNAPHVDTQTPEYFGAKGDGVTDDSDAIRACIQYQKNAEGGGTVFFGMKTYMCRDLDLPGGVNLQGSGWLTVLKLNGGAAGRNLIKGQDAFFSTIRDMVLHGNKDECPDADNIVELFGTDRYLIERCRIHSCAGDGIYLDGGFTYDGINNQIRDCYIDNCVNGVKVANNCYDTILQGCDIGANTHAGLSLNQGLSTGVFDTFFWGNSQGIDAYWSANLHVSGCRFENHDLCGVYLSGVRGFVINGCNFYANAKTQSWTPQDCHIFLYGDTTYDTKDGVITGCRIGSGGVVTEYAAYGIYDYNSPHVDYIMVTGNVIRGNGTAAVTLAGANNVVTNNL